MLRLYQSKLKIFYLLFAENHHSSQSLPSLYYRVDLTSFNHKRAVLVLSWSTQLVHFKYPNVLNFITYLTERDSKTLGYGH